MLKWSSSVLLRIWLENIPWILWFQPFSPNIVIFSANAASTLHTIIYRMPHNAPNVTSNIHEMPLHIRAFSFSASSSYYNQFLFFLSYSSAVDGGNLGTLACCRACYVHHILNWNSSLFSNFGIASINLLFTHEEYIKISCNQPQIDASYTIFLAVNGIQDHQCHRHHIRFVEKCNEEY